MSDFKFISSFPSLEPIPCFLATTVLLLIDRIMSHSFQLPDLLGIINCLELRTNRFCPFATDTSEKWFFEEITTGNNNNNNNNNSSCIIIISPAELSYLRSTKLGLLAALCFPTCDAPQLRLLTDFLTMLFYSHIRALSSSTTTPSQTLVGHSSLSDSMIQAMWNTATTTDSESATANGRESGLDILENHVLFKQFSKKKFIFQSFYKLLTITQVSLIHESLVSYPPLLTPGNPVSPNPFNSIKPPKLK
jgi:hypothetical protein